MLERSVMVRVKDSTRDWIRMEAEWIVEAIENGHMKPLPSYRPDTINPKCSGLSMDAMILLLLEDRQRHRERRKRSKKTPGRRREVSTDLIDLGDLLEGTGNDVRDPVPPLNALENP
jgi:hypothetical protein